MAFTSTVTKAGEIQGRMRVVYGTCRQVAGDTGGVVATGLNRIEKFTIDEVGSSTASSTVWKISGGATAFPASSGNVTLISPRGALIGSWKAEGV